MKKSTMMIGTVLVSTALALSGCSGGGTKTANEGDGAINVVLNANPAGKAIESLVDEYSKETGAKVTVQVLAEQQMRDKVQLNLQSKSSAMDVFMTLPSREGPLFSASGYYEPLDSRLSAAPSEFDAAGFASAAMSGMKVDGKIVALPINVEGPVMFYRKDVLKELGLKVPETIDELIDAAATIKSKKSDSMVGVTLRGAADAVPYTFGPFIHADGLSWTTEGKANFSDPRAEKAIQRYATLAADYGPPGVINYSFNESTNLFASGGAAFMLEANGQLAGLLDPASSKVADTVGVANFPGGTAGSVPTILSWGLSVSQFSKNKDASWAFMQWMTDPQRQLTLSMKGISPPRKAIFDDPTFTKTLDVPAKNEMVETVKYLLDNGNPEVGPVGSKAPAMRKVIGDGVGAAILGGAPTKSAAQIQEQLTPLLAEPK